MIQNLLMIGEVSQLKKSFAAFAKNTLDGTKIKGGKNLWISVDLIPDAEVTPTAAAGRGSLRSASMASNLLQAPFCAMV